MSPAVLNVGPAPVEAQAPSAPSAASTDDAHAFGQQLRDARESLNPQTADATPTGSASSKRAAGRGQRRSSPADGNTHTAVPVAPVSSRPSPALQFSLDIGLTAGKDAGADKDTDAQVSASQGAADADATSANAGDEPQGQLNAQSNTQSNTMLPVAPDPASQVAVLPTELTFAVKLDPQTDAKNLEAVKDNGKPAQEAAPARTAAPSKGPATVVTAVEEAHRTEPQSDATAQRTDTLSRLAAFQTPAQNSPGSSPEGAAEPHLEPGKALETATLQTVAAEPASKSTGPLKDLSIQVGQTQQDRVELRVVDRSGEVQVAVRASNPDVAQGLRQGLSDLVDRLQQSGFRAEAWRPGATVGSIQGAGESRQKEMQFQRDGSQSQSGGSQQGRQQNSQSQTYRPKWVQELEGSLSDGKELNSGDSYGIAS